METRIYIGTSGFSYKDWLGNFYPQFCPPADFLKFYASRFATVEIDATFYRMPTREMVTRWAKTTPDEFLFAAKFPRTVTHEGEVAERVDNARHFVEVMRHLGNKLGPLLMQFPYSFKPDQKSLLLTLMEAVPEDIRVSVELRNRKWLDHEEVFRTMRDRNIAFCQIDHPWMPRVTTPTADFAYLRFLGDRKKIEDDFSYVRLDRTEELDWWSDLVTRLTEGGISLYAYFNNHYSGHAPSTAMRLLELIRQKTPA